MKYQDRKVWLVHEGKGFGPFSIEQLCALRKTEILDADDSVWEDGESNSRPISLLVAPLRAESNEEASGPPVIGVVCGLVITVCIAGFVAVGFVLNDYIFERESAGNDRGGKDTGAASVDLTSTEQGAIDTAKLRSGDLAPERKGDEGESELRRHNSSTSETDSGALTESESGIRHKLAGSRWVNSNNATFEWKMDGRLIHNGVDRTWEVIDSHRGRIIFAKDHIGILEFNEDFTQFKQLIRGGPASFQGRRER